MRRRRPATRTVDNFALHDRFAVKFGSVSTRPIRSTGAPPHGRERDVIQLQASAKPAQSQLHPSRSRHAERCPTARLQGLGDPSFPRRPIRASPASTAAQAQSTEPIGREEGRPAVSGERTERTSSRQQIGGLPAGARRSRGRLPIHSETTARDDDRRHGCSDGGDERGGERRTRGRGPSAGDCDAARDRRRLLAHVRRAAARRADAAAVRGVDQAVDVGELRAGRTAPARRRTQSLQARLGQGPVREPHRGHRAALFRGLRAARAVPRRQTRGPRSAPPGPEHATTVRHRTVTGIGRRRRFPRGGRSREPRRRSTALARIF